jgi:hypothetical protein
MSQRGYTVRCLRRGAAQPANFLAIFHPYCGKIDIHIGGLTPICKLPKRLSIHEFALPRRKVFRDRFSTFGQEFVAIVD